MRLGGDATLEFEAPVCPSLDSDLGKDSHASGTCVASTAPHSGEVPSCLRTVSMVNDSELPDHSEALGSYSVGL